MNAHNNPFRLNVGFIVAESNGYSREFPVEIPEVRLQELLLHDVDGSVTFTRTQQGLLAQVDLPAIVTVECIRCLEAFDLKITPKFTELYFFSKFSPGEGSLILPETLQVDLGPLIREYMLLEIPIKPLCREDCKGLCPICGENQNFKTCNHDEEVIDPRLSVLGKLLQSDKSDD